MASFGERLTVRAAAQVPACVGLDPFADRVPGVVAGMAPAEVAAAIEAFGEAVIEAIAGVVPVLKPQSALFERWGAPGAAALARLVRTAREAGLLVVLDGKRGDIGSTAEAYAAAQLDDDGPVGADAVTVSPYLGPESLAPYARRFAHGKGIFVLLRTSNPGAAAWQAAIAPQVAEWIGAQGDAVGAVVGATLPHDEVRGWRRALPDTWWLVPGFGAQGAGPDDVRHHFRPDGTGAIVTSSREVLFPPAGHDDDPRRGVAERCRRFAASVALARDARMQ